MDLDCSLKEFKIAVMKFDWIASLFLSKTHQIVVSSAVFLYRKVKPPNVTCHEALSEMFEPVQVFFS